MQVAGVNFTNAAMEKVRAANTQATDEKLSSLKTDPAEAAAQMERLFATLLVKEMRRALPNGFFGKGAGTDIFEGWLDEHLGNSLSQSGALDMAGRIRLSIEEKQSIAARDAEQRANTQDTQHEAIR